ncbi:MAG: protease modulator HflC [Rhodospirillaceae bacterium]|jgi:modulator of FtsH protease HflC|nr:protease modulator HflC [Rhodospirillaceae bacterium]
MSSGKLLALGVIFLVVPFTLTGTLFTVHQTQNAIVLQLGEPKRVIEDPGLHLKLPFIQNVVFYDNRVLDIDPPAQEMPLVNQLRIIVDAFARYRIVDPLKFYQTVRTEIGFRDRFGTILNGSVRDALGQAQLADLLTVKRVEVMQQISTGVSLRAPDFGIDIIDVRIGRTDLPEQTSQSVYNRMRSERLAQAALLRAQGQEAKSRIEAEADRERTIIIAEAERQAQISLGQGEAESRTILNAAHGQDAEFYGFLRSMEAYRASLGEGTTMVLSPDSEFFRFFGDLPGSRQ